MTTTKRLHPALGINPTLPTYIDANNPAEQAVRSKVLETRARHWGTAEELVLLASAQARNLDSSPASALRTAGPARPSVIAGDPTAMAS